jgi:hypothetical protein
VSAIATAVYTAFTIAAVVIALISWRVSRKQTKALENEINARMRPWVGLYDFEYRRSDDDKPVLLVKLTNKGPLPAQDADLKVVIRPVQWMASETPNPAESTKKEEKSLMPSEDGEYTLNLARFPQVDLWIATDRDLVAEGTFTYALGTRKFESKFLAELWFSRLKPKNENRWLAFFMKPTTSPKLVQTNWRNISAT